MTLSSYEVGYGTLSHKGKGNTGFSYLPSVPGTATTAWDCSAKKKKDYASP